MELEVLKIWPDWKPVRMIGEGSFGKVYEITRNNFGIEEHCALKVISIPSSEAELESMRNDGMDDESITTYYKGLVEEFVQEIALMSKLKGNNHVVGYEDYAVIDHKGSIGWDILIRMELLTPLPTHLRNKPVTEIDVINMSVDICTALELCYRERIIHRDIKLDNIFVSKDGKYKLGDFGVARTIEKTVSGLSKKGTYTYMAPEVYKGEPYGTNVDLYSLGIVMYKLLNNNREPFLPPHPQPITHTNKNDALVKRLSGRQIPPPTNAGPYLQKIVLKACSFVSKDRYQTPMQMKGDLLAVKNSKATGVAPVLQFDQIARAKTNTTAQKNPNTPGARTVATQGVAQVPNRNTNQSNRQGYNPNANVNVPNRNNTPVPNRNNTPVPNRSYNAGAVNNSYKPAGAANNMYNAGSGSVSKNNSVNPAANKPKKSSKRNLIFYIFALIVGWMGTIGWLFEVVGDISYVEFNLPFSILIAISMLLLSIRGLYRMRIPVAVFMLVIAIASMNWLCIAAAILFMCMKRTEK